MYTCTYSQTQTQTHTMYMLYIIIHFDCLETFDSCLSHLCSRNSTFTSELPKCFLESVYGFGLGPQSHIVTMSFWLLCKEKVNFNIRILCSKMRVFSLCVMSRSSASLGLWERSGDMCAPELWRCSSLKPSL